MTDPRPDLAALIAARRSVGRLGPEPVAREVVAELIAVAVRAPNHHLTEPWRFVVLAGPARRRVGDAHLRAVQRERVDLTPEVSQRERTRLERAPVVIACVVRPGPDPVCAREDRDAVAAAVQNLLLAAHAHGLGAMWRTGTMVDEPEVREALGVAAGEEIVAFVYLGHPHERLGETRTARLPIDDVTEWRGWPTD